MQLTFAVTGLYLAEYMFHTGTSGLDAYDALVKTARGDMAWPDISSLWEASLFESIGSPGAGRRCT